MKFAFYNNLYIEHKLMNELIIKFQQINVNKDVEEYIKDF